MILKQVSVLALMLGTMSWGAGVASAQDDNQDADTEVRLGEVVVTARKQDERLIDSPVAVSVLNDEFFEQTGVNTMTDLVRSVPGLDYTPTNTTRAQGARIRGISTFSFSDGFESSVATVIDGVVMGREAQGFFDLFDVESAEVIKGPQGTLFGKNASAGVINIRTKLPEFEFSGGGDVMFGTDNELRLRASVTGPIIEDKLAFRLTGTSHEHDGRLENRLPGQDDVNDKDTWALRGKLLFTPTDNFSALLTLDTVQEDNACCLATYRVPGDPSILFDLALNPNVLQLQDALNQVGIVAGPGNRAVAVNFDNISQESEASGASLELNYDFGGLEFVSITAFRDWEIDEFNEADQLSISDVNNRNGTFATTEQFSQEFRLSGNISESVDFVAGLFYFDEDLYADGRVFVEVALPFPPFFNAVTQAERTVNTESTALFGEMTWNVTDRFSLIGGARFTDEEKSATYSRIATPINPLFPSRGNFGVDIPSGAQTVSDTNLSGRIIARYKLADDINTYLTWSRGYKGPGIDVAETVNPAAIMTPGGLPVLDPEIPTLWEVGLKGRFFNDSLLMNTALFHESVEDLQTISRSVITNSTLNVSIEEVISKGVEADITYLPSFAEGLAITSGVTWLDVKYEEFSNNPALEGTDLANVPEWALSLDGNYVFDLGETGWEGFARAEYFWQDKKNEDDARTMIDAYSLINLRAGATSPNGKYKVTLAVENAADEDYPYFIGGSSYSAVDGSTTSQYLAPGRLVRLTLGAKF